MQLLYYLLHLLFLLLDFNNFSLSLSLYEFHLFKDHHSKVILFFILALEMRLVLLGAASMWMLFVLFPLTFVFALYLLKSVNFIL